MLGLLSTASIESFAGVKEAASVAHVVLGNDGSFTTPHCVVTLCFCGDVGVDGDDGDPLDVEVPDASAPPPHAGQTATTPNAVTIVKRLLCRFKRRKKSIE
ncbi:hypothetical protein MAFF211471_50880 (plasmid) [Ralstonia solanacearum]|nr:hypothetical protein 7 [Ralstonia solanacearum]BCI56271.1 hypothetical protein 7 [Ralstonia solanacearum]BCI56309.1 hypothetical protein 7 [Ralstonia solanacearum]BCI56347.1 hypothetical protein 7 [Ralstonia solanacearum]BCL90000.1 hypothetical protein MAFF211471_50880 [Ralstonia solanacearum]